MKDKAIIMEIEEKPKERKYGRIGCIIAVLVIILIIILMASGIFGFSEET